MNFRILRISFSLPSLFFSLLANAQPSVLGEWANFRNGGAEEVERGQCAVRLVEERRYTIFPSHIDNVEYDAVYATMLHWHWIVKKRPTCALPKAASKSVYIQLRTWGVDLRPLVGNRRFKATASFKSCVGEFCADKESYTQERFETNLDFSTTGILIDDGVDKGAEKIIFQPITSLQREANSIMREFLDALSRLTPPKVGIFVDNRVDFLAFPRTREDMVVAMENYYRARLENHSAYVIVQAYKLEKVKNRWPEFPIVHAIVSHKQTDGSQFPEAIDLVFDGTSWKLLILN